MSLNHQHSNDNLMLQLVRALVRLEDMTYKEINFLSSFLIVCLIDRLHRLYCCQGAVTATKTDSINKF